MGGNMSNKYLYSGSNELSLVGWFDGNYSGGIHPVGSKAANELGIYDMSGNVSEWCNDWSDRHYYHNSPSQNPQGPDNECFVLPVEVVT
jgi:formylglycine-generating enzyme required for sulfatase activity